DPCATDRCRAGAARAHRGICRGICWRIGVRWADLGDRPVVKLWDRIRNLTTELSGRSGRLFADLLGEQVAAPLEGAELVRSGTTKRHAPSAGDVRDEISDVEHRGDRARGRLIEQLSRSLVTPIDRED